MFDRRRCVRLIELVRTFIDRWTPDACPLVHLDLDPWGLVDAGADPDDFDGLFPPAPRADVELAPVRSWPKAPTPSKPVRNAPPRPVDPVLRPAAATSLATPEGGPVAFEEPDGW